MDKIGEKPVDKSERVAGKVVSMGVGVDILDTYPTSRSQFSHLELQSFTITLPTESLTTAFNRCQLRSFPNVTI